MAAHSSEYYIHLLVERKSFLVFGPKKKKEVLGETTNFCWLPALNARNSLSLREEWTFVNSFHFPALRLPWPFSCFPAFPVFCAVFFFRLCVREGNKEQSFCVCVCVCLCTPFVLFLFTQCPQLWSKNQVDIEVASGGFSGGHFSGGALIFAIKLLLVFL